MQRAVAVGDGLGLVIDRDDAAALEVVPRNHLVAPRAHMHVHVAAPELLLSCPLCIRGAAAPDSTLNSDVRRCVQEACPQRLNDGRVHERTVPAGIPGRD